MACVNTKKFKRMLKQLKKEKGREPTLEEIRRAMSGR